MKLQVFKTENKVMVSIFGCIQEFCPLTLLHVDLQGWGVRAGEPILSGTFVCEYIGEILDEQEANNRLTRFHFLIYEDSIFTLCLLLCFMLNRLYDRISGTIETVATTCVTLILISMI